MAHIISCMADADEPFTFDTYITKPSSPQPQNDSVISPPGASAEKQSFAWRMFQPESRKYQLFPKGGQTSTSKDLDPEQAFTHAISQSSKADKSEKLSAASNGLRLRIKEHNLNRRRKISVPELGPMTTVQEASMDSPTIPGRPPLHERSISAPGTCGKQNQRDSHVRYSPIDEVTRSSPSPALEGEQVGSSTPKQPCSSRKLPPLVIPSQQGSVPKLSRQNSLTRLRSGSTPGESMHTRSARSDETLRNRTPFTPLSATTATTQMTSSTIPTPASAPLAESRASPHSWESRAGATTPTHNVIERAATPKSEEPRSAGVAVYGHRRGYSESGSIMDRGRPKKRTERTAPNFTFNPAASVKKDDSKRSKSAERRMFEELPKGWKASDVSNNLSPTELSDLQKQAYGQASRFEILRKEDVNALSRELRHLDERTEYLRRTYTSLRAGRRNLHSRICQYLRSPRVAKFSGDSMLKQEEALAELDASIDDWVTKLEKAENRRTRVRQKLLEHVAAAATLPVNNSTTAASESLQQAMGVRTPQYNGVGNISTPPRSPTKCSFTATSPPAQAPPAQTPARDSPSPHRVVAQVPSTILEQPLVEEAAAVDDDEGRSVSLSDRECESIRVYADSDVYALLADVESEFTKMNVPSLDGESAEIHRARSHDLLCGTARPDSPTTDTSSTRVPSPREQGEPASETKEADKETKEAAKEEAKEDAPIFLTNAVFRPKVPQRSLTAS